MADAVLVVLTASVTVWDQPHPPYLDGAARLPQTAAAAPPPLPLPARPSAACCLASRLTGAVAWQSGTVAGPGVDLSIFVGDLKSTGAPLVIVVLRWIVGLNICWLQASYLWNINLNAEWPGKIEATSSGRHCNFQRRQMAWDDLLGPKPASKELKKALEPW